MKSFNDLNLIEQILQAVKKEGYTTPTPIQAKSIPHLLEGRDLLGCAQTGTGKTAAFALPILQRLSQSPRKPGRLSIRALVLTPTRELAAQIDESFRTYGRQVRLKHAVIFGGVGKRPQQDQLKKGVDILVATPGRLLDLMSEGYVDLKSLEIFVLDEADRMLDMGFIHDVRRVIKALPQNRQSLFFSATMPKDVAQLADTLLDDPVKVEVAPQATPAERIRQSVLFVDKGKKNELLVEMLSSEKFERVLVFTRTKHRANRVAQKLSRADIPADAIHGNKAQAARTRALKAFRDGDVRVLVATDIAARGIDIDGITHVINYELPNEPESYVHRIGRTARAGNDGSAVSFCAGDERDYLHDIERTMRLSINVVRGHPCHSEEAERGFVGGEKGSEVRKRNAPGRNGRSSQKSSAGRARNAKSSGSSDKPARSEPRKKSGNHSEPRSAEASGNKKRTRRRPRRPAGNRPGE